MVYLEYHPLPPLSEDVGTFLYFSAASTMLEPYRACEYGLSRRRFGQPVHEFRSFAGITPEVYVRHQTQWTNHVRIAGSSHFYKTAAPTKGHAGDMSSSPMKNYGSAVIPGLRYRNAPRAIEWLCQAFGFAKHAVYANPDGTIAHAELTFGPGMIMLGSAENPNRFAPLMGLPSEMSGRNTVSLSLITADPDGLYQRAQAAGAEIMSPLEEMSYGGKAFSCRDQEGYLWHFGSYDPWAAQAPAEAG